MKLGCATVAYCEERFIVPFIQTMQNRVSEILVLNSTHPWNGDAIEKDNTANIARSLGATVFEEYWPTEHEQRNIGQIYFSDCDWVIILDPDEYLLDTDWDRLVKFLETAPLDGYVTGMQHTLWKNGFVIDPPEDYRQIIAVRPNVRFFDKRCVDAEWGYAPTELWHYSWRRSDAEVWRKITTYAHANEFDPFEWFSNVWSDPERLTDLHPLTPASLAKAMRIELPEELKELGI